MQRVNWAAKSDYEFVQNYKLLQVAFTKNRVQRHIDVDKVCPTTSCVYTLYGDQSVRF